MKKYTGYFIIGAAIIIASIIISTVIYTKQTSSLEDCYKKVYKSELKSQKKFNVHGKKQDKKTYTRPIEDLKAEAAIQARRDCKI